MAQPLRILSLDGGGVRGISSLCVLKELMAQTSRQRAAENPNEPKSATRPCDVFDLICGTSTGGLIALMLGRLEMVFPLFMKLSKTVDDCFKAYLSLAQEVFTAKPKLKATNAKFDDEILERRIKEIIQTQNVDMDDPLAHPDGKCKTFVVATIVRAASNAVLMQTYDNFPSSEAFDCTIWQAARAKSAAPTFFKPIEIERVQYADGGVGHNNPAELAIHEAHKIWPGRPISCLVSIGTGIEDAIQLGDGTEGGKGWKRALLGTISPSTEFGIEVAEWCLDLLTSSERTNRDLKFRADRLGIQNHYFRFNVPQGMSKIGLEDWKRSNDMIALAKSYMLYDVVTEKETVAKYLLYPNLAR
jgi:predicted acylesterase/phospholipase RssA